MSVCICGQLKEKHFPMIRGGSLITLDATGGLVCGGFREVLDWPDSEGEWRIDSKWKWPLLSLCYFDAKAELVWMFGRGHGFTQPMFEAAFGPARFTKLNETNPFAER